ncbi:F-box protein At2g02240-like [Rutidosis leptorrhynchoides]|uniref:F-box protein At2g02240-like n=1 Tax=Rutidosis leptorrhynchoides TaxID=125765 RepID=UPI003A999E36
MCFLVFKLSKESQGMYCPVKVRDLLHHENKEPEIIYLSNQKKWNSHDFTRVPKEREDGWMEVHVSKFDLNRELDQDGCLRVRLKFISYEGTMPGLVVNGLEFRPIQTSCTLGADDEEPLLKLGDDAEPMVDSIVAHVAIHQ